MGLFAREEFDTGQLTDGLAGLLTFAPALRQKLKVKITLFSQLPKNRFNFEKIVGSFMNSSCTPQCVLIPRVKTGRTKKSLKVNGTALNEQILLRSVEVFWDPSMSITCPHSNEFNGDRVRIYDKRTSYGLTFWEFLVPKTFSISMIRSKSMGDSRCIHREIHKNRR